MDIENGFLISLASVFALVTDSDLRYMQHQNLTDSHCLASDLPLIHVSAIQGSLRAAL